jgi:hypothetical protein
MMHCESCGSEVPGYDIVNCGSVEHGDRHLCNQCFNAEVASAQGLESFENRRFDPIVMSDCAGEEHEFHFRTRLLGAVVAMDAFEVERGRPAGYRPDISPRSWTTRTWEELGRMLMTFEGWQFRMVIRDRSEEV